MVWGTKCWVNVMLAANIFKIVFEIPSGIRCIDKMETCVLRLTSSKNAKSPAPSVFPNVRTEDTV